MRTKIRVMLSGLSVLAAYLASGATSGSGHLHAQTTGTPVFAEPSAVAVDGRGNVYVADAQLNRIVKLSPTGTVLITWGVNGSKPGAFDRPSAVAVDHRGAVYVADAGNGRVERFSASGKLRGVWSSSTFWGGRPTGFYSLVPTLALRLGLDRSGHVFSFVPCPGCSRALRLWEYSSIGKLLHQWSIRVHLPGSRTQLTPYAPLGIAIGSHTSLYISFAAQGQSSKGTAAEYFFIQRRSSSGTLQAQWGGVNDEAGDPAPPQGTGMVVTQAGNLLMTDGGNHRIVEYTPNGKILAAWGMRGCGPGLFDTPDGLALDRLGNIYVTDRGNGTIQKLHPNGMPISLWGQCRRLP